jgi:heme-degrading monooxygenase HmoA
MPIVRINAIEVPEDSGDALEERFRHRLGAVDDQPGFLGFELLRPTGDAERRWFVVTHWENKKSFDDWVSSAAFQHGHAGSDQPAPHGGPVATGSQLLEFDVVLSSARP